MQFKNISFRKNACHGAMFDSNKNSALLCLSFQQIWLCPGDMLKAPHPRLLRFLFKVAAGLENGRYRRLETTPAPPIPLRRFSPLSRVPLCHSIVTGAYERERERKSDPAWIPRDRAKEGKRACGVSKRKEMVEDALIQDGWVLCVYQRGCRRPRKYPDVTGPRVSHISPSRKYFTRNLLFRFLKVVSLLFYIISGRHAIININISFVL